MMCNGVKIKEFYYVCLIDCSWCVNCNVIVMIVNVGCVWLFVGNVVLFVI